MAKPEITATSLGIVAEAKKVTEVLVLPRGRLKTTTVRERKVSVASIPVLDRPLPWDEP